MQTTEIVYHGKSYPYPPLPFVRLGELTIAVDRIASINHKVTDKRHGNSPALPPGTILVWLRDEQMPIQLSGEDAKIFEEFMGAYSLRIPEDLKEYVDVRTGFSPQG